MGDCLECKFGVKRSLAIKTASKFSSAKKAGVRWADSPPGGAGKQWPGSLISPDIGRSTPLN